jgi:hypothetical protein
MDLATQRRTSGSIGITTSKRTQIAVALAALALLATAASWIVIQSAPARAGLSAAANSVSDPVNVEFRRGEHDSLGAGAANSVSDPVNVEFRRGERTGD